MFGVELALTLTLAMPSPKLAQADLEDKLWREDPQTVRELIAAGNASIATLRGAEKFKSVGARRAAVFVLSSICTPEAGKALTPFLANDSPEVLRDAVVAILYVNKPTTFGHHGEPHFRGDIETLKSIGAKALPGLEEALSHRTYGVRCLATSMLKLVKDPRVVDIIKRNFSDVNVGGWALSEAALALANYPSDKRIYPLLISRVEYVDPAYEFSGTGYALTILGEASLPYILEAMRVKPPNGGQIELVPVAHKIGGPKAVDIILLAAKSTNQYVRQRAAHYLRFHKSAAVRAELKRLLSDPSEYVRPVAKESLQWMGGG